MSGHSQLSLNRKSVLEHLANEGFKMNFEKGPIQVYSKGNEDAFYDTRTESIICRTIAYPKDKVIK